jgi:hypothetical protein
MQTQHVKFSAYVAWGSGVGGVVAVGVVFEEGEAAGLVDDDEDVAGAVIEVVGVVVLFLPSPSLLLVPFLVLLLDCIGTAEGLIVLSPFFVLLFLSGMKMGDMMFCPTLRTQYLRNCSRVCVYD